MKRLTLSISIVAGISIAAFAWWLQPSHTENTTAAEVVTNNEAEKKEPPTLGEKILSGGSVRGETRTETSRQVLWAYL